MNKWKLASSACLIGWIAPIIALAPLGEHCASAQTRVWPTSAAKLTPITLPALIASALPLGGALRWDNLQNGEVAWITEGVAFDRGSTSRHGLARVRVAGRMSTVLRQVKNELAWSITPESDEAPKFGPTRLTILPGIAGKEQCFGVTFDACNFSPEEALAGLEHRLVCDVGPASYYAAVYEVKGREGRSGTVVYRRDLGSGGETNSVVISTLRALDECHAERNAR
jgi:hypothetical protein